MTNDQDPEATIRALEEQLEAAKAKAKIEAMEAELAALKAKDADAAAATAAAAEAERARVIEAEAAAVAAREAAERTAAEARAAELKAELDALRANEAPVAVAPPAAAPVAAAATPVPVTPAQPEIVYVERPVKKKSGGLIAALVVILLSLVGTLGATYLAIKGDLRAPWATPAAAPTDILLIGAGDLGPAPAKTDSPALVVFDELSQPATGSAPEPVETLGGIQVAGDTSEMYGLSYASCFTLVETDPANADAVEAFVSALNSDETLGLGTELTGAMYPAFIQQLTFAHLLADTRVTYNGYSAGALFPVQAVLQRGTMVGIDRFGVPRAHCGSGVALTAPVAAAGGVVFAGGAWGDLDLAELVTVTPAAAAQTVFTVIPVGPSNTEAAFSVGSRACAWASPCPAPSELASKVDAPAVASSALAPVPTECSNWAPGTTDADSVPSRLVNASGAEVQGFMVQSVGEGCGTRLDFAMGVGESYNVTFYWPGTIVLFTDGVDAAPIGDYVFGEQTLFVIGQ